MQVNVFLKTEEIKKLQNDRYFYFLLWLWHKLICILTTFDWAVQSHLKKWFNLRHIYQKVFVYALSIISKETIQVKVFFQKQAR